MKIEIISDLHLEAKENIFALEEILNYPLAEIIIIAGDLCPIYMQKSIFSELSLVYKKVISVSGNHDYYRESFLIDPFKEIKVKNVNILERKKIKIEDKKIAGATMWFQEDPNNILYKNRINDFFYIRDFEENIYNVNKESIKWLNRIFNKEKIDIMISHHLPFLECIDQRYKKDQLNRFFCTNLNKYISKWKYKPKVWVFGHTHSEFDFYVDEIRCVCNPIGYPWENDGKMKRKIIEI